MTHLLILFLIVYGINLLPALAPPTWSILVLYGLNSDLPIMVIVPVSALAAAMGRLSLAHGCRLLGHRLPEKQRRNLAAARRMLEGRQRNVIVALGLFALSPLPSGQLFAAAGLAGIRLGGFTAAFFAGRLISYSIYTAAAKTIRDTNLGEAFASTLASPWGLALQIGMIILVAVLMQVDWSRFIPESDPGET